jgi:hypothetical protein
VEDRYGEDVADQVYMAKLRGKSSGPFKANTEARHPERKYCLAHADLLVYGQFEWVDRPVAETDPGWAPDLWEHVQVPGEPYIVEAKTTGMMGGKRREGQVFTGYDPDDPEPENWRERRAWLERMDARAYGGPVPGERCSHPKPMPAAELERWRAAEAKRARKAARRRGGQ